MDFSFENISLLNILDVAIVGYLMYLIYRLLRGTIAFNIVIGVIAFYIVYWLVTVLDMRLLSLLLGKFVSFGVLILIIIFQPELRKFLKMVGSRTLAGRFNFIERFINERSGKEIKMDEGYLSIIESLDKMSGSKTGALIVLTKSEDEEMLNTGTEINADLNAAMLQNIFFKNSPLHDGAVIVKEDKIIAARVILPVSENQRIDPELGLRHRAALGVTENSNMIALIVSEENGEVSYAKNGRLFRNVSFDELKTVLNEFND